MENRVNSAAMDGLSNLPEHIIHHIMSFLPTKDATHMSTLSKTFYSSWRSFPIMDLDYSVFKHSESFFDFVENSIENRMPNTCLEKLRLAAGGYSDSDKAIINKVINFSIQNNVRELELDFRFWIMNFCLTPAIFDAKSIKILNLKGFNSMSLDLVCSSPCLENLSLIYCRGFKTLTLASNAKLLKALKIKHCYDLNYIHFESTALCLESFSCCCLYVTPNISTSTAPNLKHLELVCKSTPDRWIFSEFRILQTLKIQDIYGFASKNKMIKFHLENLKTLELKLVDYDKVEIQAPNMVSFTYGSYLSAVTPEIDISSTSTNLKHVKFHGQFVDIWIQHNLSQFLSVETLEFHNCKTMKNIKIHFEYLKCLKFVSCKKLSKVEIEAPNLVSFIYEDGGDIIYAPQVIITSKAKLDVKLDFSYCQLDQQRYISMRNFLKCFGQHCQTLTLSSSFLNYNDAEWLCLRPRSVPPPLYNLKHLKVQLMGSLTYLTSLLDALLWLAPHPNIISFVVPSQVKSLKFSYKNENLESWVQDLKEYTVENFEHSEMTRLEYYFRKLYNSAAKMEKNEWISFDVKRDCAL